MIISKLKSNWPFAFILLITCLIFFKIFLKGLYPIPADLLVSFYFPWYSGGWQGYNPWTTHKELLNADSIRQIYPWKEFAAYEFKQGRLPLWNPYTFSGQPLAANFQSSAYYPLNILYFLTDTRNAWILLIVIQPFLGGIFMFLAAKSFRLSHVASIFAATGFMFSSYLITWLENGNIAHSYIWLPLAIWSINLFFENKKFRYLLILLFSLSLSIFAGHPQTAIYLFLTAGLFYIFKIFESEQHIKKFLMFVFAVIFSLAICAIQIIPTIDFYRQSPISLPFAKEVFEKSIVPYQNLVSFFASDFFGHPANNNFWSFSYGDFTPYFGVIPLIFALWAIFKLNKQPFVKFATLIAVFFILAAVRGPITYLIQILKLPILDSTTPSRFISISIFFLLLLAAFGFEDFLKNLMSFNYRKRLLKFLAIVGIGYGLLWIFAIFGKYFLTPADIWQINLAVTRRNLILPTLMFLSVPMAILLFEPLRIKFKSRQDQLRVLIIAGFFAVTLVGGLYYSNKFLPFSPKSFIFADHPVFSWLKNEAGLDRFYGQETTHIDYNFPTHYRIFGAEGYDTLRLQRYAELLASSFNGQVPTTYLRSDAVIPIQENGYRRRIFEILGLKYFLDKDDNPKTGIDWHPERFGGDQVKGVWKSGKFQIYQREPTLPRVFLSTKYFVAKNDQEIIQKIYDQNFDLKTLILEEEPPIKIDDKNQPLPSPPILKYEPMEVSFATNASTSALLYLSDAYDDNWHVTIDGQRSKILRTHYALRSVAVPAGSHRIEFKYESKAFLFGVFSSVASIVSLVFLSIYLRRIKKF